jgi:hypothetical protein
MKDNDQKQCSNTNLCSAMAFIVLFVVTAVASLGAQTATTGDIAGVVTDPTAAVLSGVSVTLKKSRYWQLHFHNNQSQGSYNFAFLQPGNYSISASGPGFQQDCPERRCSAGGERDR